MADLNVTFKKPVEFTVNGEKYAVKPLSADVGFRLSYLATEMAKREDKGGELGQLTKQEIKAYDEIAGVFANNAVKPDETRAILEALKDNDGITWMHVLQYLVKKLLA